MERRRSDPDRTSELIELERAQIGHEIHDGLLPLIFASSAAVNSILVDSDPEADRPEPAAASQQTLDKLRQVSQWLTEALQSGRHLLTRVYPPELTETTWPKAARDAVARLLVDCPAKIDWRLDPAVESTSQPVSLALYRIVVEAVRNAVTHGEARAVEITAQREDNNIRLVLQDDGVGFDPAAIPADRFGVRSMIGRASLVGGSLKVDSPVVDGRGTRITVSVPAEHES